MWAERYILVSEGIAQSGCWARLDAGKDMETDVAIEDEW